jgi:membrane complex biogenesis BtpA family protein
LHSRLFEIEKPVIGMVHLPPLPGAPRYTGQTIEELVEFAISEAKALEEGGIDAVLVENYNDYPYPTDRVPTPTLIAMAVIAHRVKAAVSVPVGVNLLFNDVENELYLAWCLGLDFIRVEGFIDLLFTDMGPLFPTAPKLMRLRQILAAEKVAILADVQGKHTQAFPMRNLIDSARDALERGGADALILTGVRTGEAASKEIIRELKQKVPNAKIFLGSGVTPENLRENISFCDGVIVGTYLKKDGIISNPIDPERVRKLMAVAKNARKAAI